MGADLKVAVVGGGPAGSFFALYLLAFARNRGESPEVDIYEPRDFSGPGPLGCNRCAGILSARLLRNIRELGIAIPEAAVQSRINAYTVISPFGTIEVANPEPGEEIYSVYRGGGPMRAPLGANASFDHFLLEVAQQRGARRRRLRVEAIRLDPHPALLTSVGWQEYDLIVLATGVNNPPLRIEGSRYYPPPTLRMAQDELLARPEDVATHFGARVKVFLLPHSPLVFGTLVPKGSLINVSLLGRRGPPPVADFLAHPLVQRELPFPYRRVCGCRPVISVGRSSHPYADGFVAIGDASVTHLYKDGIGSALVTARQAAYVTIYHGVSAGSFRRHYSPLLASLHRDNAYGRLIFRMHESFKQRREVFLAHSQLALREQQRAARHRPSSQVLWDIFTGSHSYGHILRTALGPGFLPRLLIEVVSQRWRQRRLASPVRILVAGSGFGGVYTTLRLEKVLRREPAAEITLVSRENFLLFAPLLHEVATGGIETRHIALPIRALRGRRRFRFVNAEVLSVDLEGKRLLTDRGAMAYDYLVLALGGVPDVSAAGRALTLKTIYDSIYLRNHIIRLFEMADGQSHGQEGLLTFVVVGGGPVGVQLVAEMRDFIVRHLVKRYLSVDRSLIRILLVCPDSRLLADMDSKLGDYSLALLRKKGIEVRLGSRVTRVGDREMEIDGREVIAAHTVVSVGGIVANSVVASLPVAKDDVGRVMVNRYLEVPGFPGVYAIGDNAHFAHPVTGQPLPPQAHIAVRQPGTVAHNIMADLRAGSKKPFVTPWMADMVALGSHSAALKILGFRLYGFLARVLWLGAYLSLLPHNYNRIRVAVDWFLSLFFGRDTTLLRLSSLFPQMRWGTSGGEDSPNPPPHEPRHPGSGPA
ncbi:MAG: FAD-dependent oxidoreductase [Chloroflexota bacterium]|nr:FAD-dependent oxidoreductase [Chloroflexota bacterium]